MKTPFAYLLVAALVSASACSGTPSVEVDLSVRVDAGVPVDLAVTPDLAVPDLAVTPDLAMTPDLAEKLDMVCVPPNTPTSCGTCGHVCPGVGLTSAEVACASGTCTLACRGENYDVNGDPSDGCERVHTGPGHTLATASWRGVKTCDDSSSLDSFSASLLSDARVHASPTVDGFVGAVGSAPDYWYVQGLGGVCVNDLAVTFTTTGGGSSLCYRITVRTNNLTRSGLVSGSDSVTLTAGRGAYDGGTNIIFLVEKTCSLPVQEAVAYSVSYHL